MIQYKYDLGEIVPGLTVKNRTPEQGPQAAQYLVMQSDGRIRWMNERQVDQLVHFMTKTVVVEDSSAADKEFKFKIVKGYIGVFNPDLVNTDPVPVAPKPKRGKK